MQSNDDESVAKALGELVGSLVALALTYAMRGYTISALWAWLATPVLSLPPISTPQAAGLICVVYGFVPLRRGKDERATWLVLAQNAFYCLLLLAIGKVIVAVSA